MNDFKEHETLHCNNTWWYKASKVEEKLQFLACKVQVLEQLNQELKAELERENKSHNYHCKESQRKNDVIDDLKAELEKERLKSSELTILKNEYKISIMKLLIDDKEERERLSIILKAPNEVIKKRNG
jgi:hypothetical protein